MHLRKMLQKNNEGRALAHDGLYAMSPRQQDGTGMNNDDDDVLADCSDSVDERIFLCRQREAHAVSARVVLAGEGAIVS
jgi:hypothetical protein